MKRQFTSLLFAAALAGCAAKQPPTFEKMAASSEANKSASTREYKAKSTKEVLDASHKVLYMLDPGDVLFDASGNKLYAKRAWVIYAILWSILGMDQYNVSAASTSGGVASTFAFSSESVPLIGPSWEFKRGLDVGSNENPADFKLFHDRVEYFLGIRSDWVTCDMAKANQLDKNREMFLCDSIGLENISPTDELAKKLN